MDAYYVKRSVCICLFISSFIAKEPRPDMMVQTETFLFKENRQFYVKKVISSFCLYFCLFLLRFFLLLCSKEDKELDRDLCSQYEAMELKSIKWLCK